MVELGGWGGVELLSAKTSTFPPLRPNQVLELEQMGLRPEDFQAFLDLFVGHRFDYIEKKPGASNWRLIKGRLLSNGLLIAHLRGQRWIGTGCRWDPSLGAKGRHATGYVVIDLDRGSHGPQGPSQMAEGFDEDLLARYDAVTRALGSPSCVFRSSASGGLHLYYLLAYPVELHRLREPAAQAGAVVRLLAANGVPEQPGRVEVYPRGQYRLRGPQNRIRLPFGLDSVALDPSWLTRFPTTGPVGDLRRMTELLRRRLVTLIEPDDWFSEARQLHAVASARPTRSKSPRRVDCATNRRGRDADAQALWSAGLTDERQLNGALWTLGTDLRRGGTSEGEAKAMLHDWLESKHHGCSRTYNASPELAHQEVDDVLARLYARSGPAGDWGELPGLSAWEFKRLVEATRFDHQLADSDGVPLSRFKVQRLGFELLRHAKQWVVREARWRVAKMKMSQPHLEPGSPEFAAAFATEVRAFWPDPTRPEFIVPVPFKLRESIDGIGEDSQWGFWRVLHQQGVFTLERSASAEAHRAATYRVALDFGAKSDNSGTVHSLPVGLVRLLSDEDVRLLYTRHYAQKIRAARGSADQPPKDDLTVTMIRGLLGDGGSACNSTVAA